MTKKDYVKLAQALREVPSPGAWETTWYGMVEAIANVLQEDNPRFDRAIFYNACGIAGGSY